MRIVRNLISLKRATTSRRSSSRRCAILKSPIVPETIELARLLEGWGITREGLVDLALLVGTDFNNGIKGIGPKKALKLIQQHGRLENLPDLAQFPQAVSVEIFLLRWRHGPEVNR